MTPASIVANTDATAETVQRWIDSGSLLVDEDGEVMNPDSLPFLFAADLLYPPEERTR